jgi:tRNA U34 2-thiouridine synthase MnmA/TrmU
MKKTKALALLSGGLDSTLAIKVLLEQGIQVEAINFITPFCLCKKGGCGAHTAAEKLGISLKTIPVGEDYLKIIRNPKHGYGKNMNPCIDCRIFMLKRAKQHAKQTQAAFLVTGEVLDQRPMSQHMNALRTIEEEAGLKGKILRPLSAKLLPQTTIEKKQLVNRQKLLNIHGRARKNQMQLAKQYNITDYPCPAGGCLLTYKEYANKLRDLFNHKKHVSTKDVNQLKLGRHFRYEENKIIVGRNQTENEALLRTKSQSDYYFEVPDCGSPITILQGPKTKKAIQKAAQLTAYYSHQKTKKTTVTYGKQTLNKTTTITTPTPEEVDKLRIT